MAVKDNSDYTKIRTKLYDLVPEVFRSDANKALFGNLFDRYLTKQESIRTVGYVGQGNPLAAVRRQIPEPTLHRQGHQLQPVLHSKIGSVDHMAAWEDIRNEYERLGVDMEMFDEWGAVTQFNWVPPIDIDKLINYSDYYWVDLGDAGSNPEYITIRNRCTTAQSKLRQWEVLITTYGETFPIINALTTSAGLEIPTYTIVKLTPGTDTVVVKGDSSNELRLGQFFEVDETSASNGIYRVASLPSYDASTNTTTFNTEPGTITILEPTGKVNLQRFNQLHLEGRFDQLFQPGIIFFIRDSTNTELNNKFWKSNAVEFDPHTNITIVTLVEFVTSDVADGVISLTESLNFLLADRDCQCEGSTGWDLLNWDDTPADPIWEGDYQSLITSITNPGPPTAGIGVLDQLWYSESDDTLYQYTNAAEWKVIFGSFSVIMESTTGFALWDYGEDCATQSVISSAEQWMKTNFWVHKTSIVNFAKVKQAVQPIIEYSWDLELNEWTYINHKWKYRVDNNATFQDTELKPSIIELKPIKLWELDGTDIVLDERYGDLTDFFAPGVIFHAIGTLAAYTVDRSSYVESTPGAPYQTRIILTNTNVFPPLIPGDLKTNTVSTTPLFPASTSTGDVFESYGDHWLYAGADTAIPTAHVSTNPFAIPSPFAIVLIDPLVKYEYVITQYSQQYTILTNNTINEFILGYDPHFPSVADEPTMLGLSAVQGDLVFRVDEGKHYMLINIDPTILSNWLAIDLLGSTRPLSERAKAGTDSVRVYINGIRQYGRFEEITTSIPPVHTTDVVDFVSGIRFFPGFEPTQFDTITVEVGESSIEDLGNYIVPIRTIEDNIEYSLAPVEYADITQYRRVEQVKSIPNQYPLFDIYNVDSTPANEVSPIFGFETSSDAPVNANVGLRTVQDDSVLSFSFDQFILDADNGILKAWRDYKKLDKEVWYNPATQELFFFNDLSWSKKTDMGGHYREAIISDNEPDINDRAINGLYWADTLNDLILIRDTVTNSWVDVADTVIIQTADNTLQTIWREGTNNDKYVPDKVDWVIRTESEYNSQKDLFVTNKANELRIFDPSLSETEAIVLATKEWNEIQSNPHSETGEWIGDWEVPDPLFYNNLNENKKVLTSPELLTHFQTIVDSQQRIPGFSGTSSDMFHLIPLDEVNYGVGGTIHEYNDSYDTALSSNFVNNVTPISLIEFAQIQYESMMNTLGQTLRAGAVDYFTDTTQESLLDFSNKISDDVIRIYELNDTASFVYGDTTTFTDNIGDNDLGVKNWIATLPYLKMVHAVLPEKLLDREVNSHELLHHDGHRATHEIDATLADNFIRVLIKTPDDRTKPTPADPPLDTFGRLSETNFPPNNIVDFTNTFSTTAHNREGVYWYHIPSGGQIELYRLEVVSIGESAPDTTLPEGTLWMDMTPGDEVLRILTVSTTEVRAWDVVRDNVVGDGKFHNGPTDVDSSYISAWSIVSINDILIDIIYKTEVRLYENAPSTPTLRYDFAATESRYPTRYKELLYQQFLDYTIQREITGPFINSQYDSADAFTWNYKYSVPGTGVNIIDVDAFENTITVEGNYVSLFDPCQASAPSLSLCPSTVNFFVKNSITNDGRQSTVQSTPALFAASYDSVQDVTVVRVTGSLQSGSTGIAYFGELPSSANNGSESGGHWKDFYTKLYGSSNPTIEPWLLQGFNERPNWWNDEYVNDDILKWGDRRWKYKHGFDIVDVDPATNRFSIEGDFREIFPTGKLFNIDQSTALDGNYQVSTLLPIVSVNIGDIGLASMVFDNNVIAIMIPGMQISIVDSSNNFIGRYTIKTTTFEGPPVNQSTVIVEESILDATGFDTIGGTSYDGVTNRTIITVTTTPPSIVADGRIALAVGMWEQIRQGNVKAGERYSNNVVSITGIPNVDVTVHGITDPNMPTYNYFSVNIDNTPISSDGGITQYHSDDILPPYWDHTAQFGTAPAAFDRAIRSVFFNFNGEVVTPGADYIFGDAGLVEHEWEHSSEFLYDHMIVAYKLDPIRFVTHTFGIDFVNIGGLQIDSRKERVLSHNRTDFHGEIIDSDLYQASGTNQWYINFNRYNRFDVSLADFRTLWTEWTAPLTYQMASFVDTESLNLAHRTVDIADVDYDVLAKTSPGVQDFWLDAFKVSVLSIPPKLLMYDTQVDWEFEVGTNTPRSRNIKYYDIRNYQFGVDIATDICTIYNWKIQKVSTFINAINIEGNQTGTFLAGRTIEIANSGILDSNDGIHIIEGSSYDSSIDQTIVIIEGSSLVPTIGAEGDVTVDYRSIPWGLGDSVYLSTTQLLPVPLQGDNINGLYRYFIIPISKNEFQLALTKQDAINGLFVDITTLGSGNSFVGEIAETFTAAQGQNVSTEWRRYATDNTNILTFNTPYQVRGIQQLVNIMFGYRDYTYDLGWRINHESGLVDPDTARLIDWQVEIERFIVKLYNLRTTRNTINDRYKISVDSTTDEWTFVDPNSHLITGDGVNVITTDTLPSPIVQGLRYYIIRDVFNTFKLAASKQDAVDGNAIDITSNGTGDQFILLARNISFTAPSIEVNPFRSAVWFKPERGIISNVITGPTEDIKESHLLFDQYGRPLTINQIRVFREDNITQINIAPELANDVEVGSDVDNLYNYIHLGGAHLFVDAFEHVTKFKNYTSSGSLIYDPFLGLSLRKIEYDYDRQGTFTQRPNMGGFYLQTQFNQNASLSRNIEANIEDLRYAYDTYRIRENNLFIKTARDGLGYTGSASYLDNINLNNNSQFTFWRGMIQHKGSINAVDAYINSRRFVNAAVDEFWAYKVADFGSSLEFEHPEMFITTVDSRSNDLRLEFVTTNNPTASDGFTVVAGSDEDRWYRQPDQVEILRNNGANLYFNVDATNQMEILADVNIPDYPFIRHNFNTSNMHVIATHYDKGFFNSVANGTVVLSGTINEIATLADPYIVGTSNIEVYVDNISQILGVDYTETDSNTITFNVNVFGLDLEVHFLPAQLNNGVQYNVLNSNIIELLDPTILPAPLSLWGLSLIDDPQTPARLIDRKSETIITAIQHWDPARNIHFFNSMHNIDLFNDADLALYNEGTNNDSTPTQIGPWGSNQVGDTWFDTQELDYIPYYDEQVFPLVETRLRLWGQLAPWANGKVYEWVKSNIPPSEWDSVAAKEEGDNTILPVIRKSGKARKVLFENISTDAANPIWKKLRHKYEEFDSAIEGTFVTAHSYNFNVSTYVSGIDFIRSWWNQEVATAANNIETDVTTFIDDFNTSNGYTAVDPNFKTRIYASELTPLARTSSSQLFGISKFEPTLTDYFDQPIIPYPIYPNGFDQPPVGVHNGFDYEVISGTSGIVLPNPLYPLAAKESTEVTVIPDVSATLNNTHFVLHSANDVTQYYVWYNVNGAGTDPAPGGTGIEILLNTDASAVAVANATSVAINAIPDFNVTNFNNIITITNVVGGDTTNIDPGTTNFGINTTTEGTDIVPAISEVTDISTLADVATSLNSTYFRIHLADNTQYYVWYNVDTTGIDPGPGGIGIEIAITQNDPASVVALATSSTLDATADFSATNINNIITVINAAGGVTTDASSGTSGFNINVTTDGVDAIPAEAEVTGITTVADLSPKLNGTHFLINSANDITEYYVWYSVDGTGIDPSPGGTGILVSLSQNDIASAVASATASAITSIPDFNAASFSDKVTITNTNIGETTNAVSATTNFNVVVVTEGTNTIPTERAYLPSEASAIFQSVADGYRYTKEFFYNTISVSVDIYINGILYDSQVSVTPEPILVQSHDIDRVRIVLPVPTQTEIDAANQIAINSNGIEPMPYLQDYQYSSFIKYSDINLPKTEYYFWVEDKSTFDRSTTRTLSAKIAEQNLIDIPTAYLVTQKMIEAEDIPVETGILLPRAEYSVVPPSSAPPVQDTYVTGLPIVTAAPVTVYWRGNLVDPIDYTINAQSITFNLVTHPLYVGDDIKIEYSGDYTNVAKVPHRFVQAIIRGLRGLVQADRRYTIRFAKDFTLRDDINNGATPLELKDNHQEWKLFREFQQTAVDRYLWNKITESMIGHALTDSSVRIPSLNRALYDAQYLTDTQFGLRDGQAFTDGETAIQTIIADLTDTAHDFSPVSIDVFFQLNNFDTTEGIIEAMDTIYTTFGHEHTNRMYFAVLHDAFSFKNKYEDIFKTSMVSLHDIEVLRAQDVLDD